MKTMVPQTPREDGPSAQDGEEEAEEPVFEVVTPGSVNDEPCRDDRRREHQEEGRD